MSYSFTELEFEKILEYISKYCLTDDGKSILKSSVPYATKEACLLEAMFVQEAKDILINAGDFPLEYLPPLREKIRKCSIEGSVLEAKEIREIYRLAKISRIVYNFLRNSDKQTKLYELFANDFFIDKNFENQIERVIDEDCGIKASSSKRLKEIREQILEKSEILRKVITAKLKSLSENYLAREEYVTLRDGRMVLPIKVEHKRKVRGFIHSESSTGQTVYIEPEETLELNNEIVSLQFEEKREIERLLRELTKLIGNNSSQLIRSYESLIRIDCIFAKARYSIEILGAFPSFDEKKKFAIIDGRHPILYKRLGREKTIPLNLSLDEDKKVIIITGPNAGGKTASIKTIGLLCLMAQSGFHIPVSPDSNFYFFENILADIGDKQSIEDDLSAYSSKLVTIKGILENVNDKSLVLLDELGSSTDPAEGAALAGAILISLRNKNCLTFATTHLGDLKILANSEAGFENASMEFDLINLAPTYKLRVGLPGSSYAFEVAKRLGFDNEILSLAGNLLDKDRSKAERFIVDLEEKIRLYASKLSEIEEENIKLKDLTKKYQSLIESLNKEKAKILENAKQKGEDFLVKANKEIEKAIKLIKETNADKNAIALAKNSLNELKKDFEEINNEIKSLEETGTIKQYLPSVGDYVTLKDTNAVGVIKEISKEKGLAYVAIGGLKVMCKISDLRPATKEDIERISLTKKNRVEINPGGELSAPKSIILDLRGLRYNEAEKEIIKFIDSCYTNNLDRVEIIHGKGNGVLKKLTWDILKNDSRIKNFYFAPIELGGDGVTIVEFK